MKGSGNPGKLKPPSDPEPFVDAIEAGGFLQLRPRRVLELARRGTLPAYPDRGWGTPGVAIPVVRADFCCALPWVTLCSAVSRAVTAENVNGAVSTWQSADRVPQERGYLGVALLRDAAS